MTVAPTENFVDRDFDRNWECRLEIGTTESRLAPSSANMNELGLRLSVFPFLATYGTSGSAFGANGGTW